MILAYEWQMIAHQLFEEDGIRQGILKGEVSLYH
jgi:hypothetical protein